MTATMIAGAASHTAVNWHAINWQKAHQIVRRLQARIVQAEQAGKRGKVKALQRLLMRRSRARQRAFERLELLEGKLSRAVLRGRDGGNTVLLPGVGCRKASRLPYNPPKRCIWLLSILLTTPQAIV